MRKRALLLIAATISTGCVSNQAVQTVQAGDEAKSCPAIQAELAQLGVKFEDVKDDSGVTGKNVGLALVFWPGIIVNEVRSNKNQDSIDSRISHLSGIYNSRCLSDEAPSENSGSVADRLRELDELRESGLISEAEYDAARDRALGSI